MWTGHLQLARRPRSREKDIKFSCPHSLYLELDRERGWLCSKGGLIDAKAEIRIMMLIGLLVLFAAFANVEARPFLQIWRPQSSAETPNSEPLSGCPWNGFSVEAHVGPSNANVKVKLFVDTGSTTTAIATSTCSNCGISTSFAPIYDHDVSLLQALYGDGTGWSGYVTTQRLSFDELQCAVQMRIGAIISQNAVSNFFGRPCAFNSSALLYDGILGLGTIEIALPSTDALLDKVDNAPFSITMCDSVGELWLGAPDTTNWIWNYGDIRWVARNTPGFWGVQFSLLLNDILLSDAIPSGLVDSGTTLLLLPTSLFQSLQTALDTHPAWISTFGPLFFSRRICLELFGNLTEVEASLPALTLGMRDMAGAPFVVRLRPLRSLVLPKIIGSSQQVAFCPGISSFDSTYAILGWSVLGQSGIVFDARQHRVGFVPITNLPCDARVMSRTPRNESESDVPLCVSAAEERSRPLAAVALAFLGLLFSPFFRWWNFPLA
jgi:hypothetical protein